MSGAILTRLSMLRLLHCLLLLIGTLAAQDTTPASAPQDVEISVAALEARLEATQADRSLAPELKARLVEFLTRAVDSAKVTEAQRHAQRRYEAARASAPARMAERAGELQAIESRRVGPPPGEQKLADLEQGLLAAQQAQAGALRHASDLDRELARRGERRTSIPTQIADLSARLDALPAQPVEVPDSDPRLAAARRLALLAERRRLQTETDTLNAELQSLDAEVELMRTERDLAARSATAAKADADAWLAVLQPLRTAEAQRIEREAQASALRADPRVASLASGNADLARAAARLVEQREQVDREKAERDAERLDLQLDFDEVKKRVELVGATDAVGALLRQRRAQLADTHRVNQRRTMSRRDRIADAQLQSLDSDQRRRQLVENPETWLQRELGGAVIASSLPGYVIDEARRLRDARRDLLKLLSEGHAGLLKTLTDLEKTEHQLGDLIARYRAFVAERVLGIRSSAPIWDTDWRAIGEALAWLGSAPQWWEVGRLWLAGMFADGWPFALLVPLLVLIGLRFFLRRRLVLHGDVALDGRNVSYLPTALAAADTVLLALPLPALLWFFGWRLGANPECSEFGKAVAAGAMHSANALLLVLALRELLVPKGLAEAHFRWQATTIPQLRRALPVLLMATVPFGFVVAALELPGEDRWQGSLGRCLMIVELGLLVFVFWRLLHPRTGIVGGSVKPLTTAIYRFRRLWFFLGAGVPATLLLMVALGYDYTALQLGRRLHLTITVLLLAVFLHAMIVRWLVLQRRFLQMRRAKERLEATKAGEPASAAAGLAAETVDPQSLARQTQTLLRGAITLVVLIATYRIWVDVLPALSVLHHVELWTGGSEAAPMVITLANVLLALLILLVATAAARNLPALLELLVLQRLNMQPGERYAIATLARYGIFGVGMVLAFSAIGIGWSKVQWLAAAVSVGLGFGLQEVFANFVSGLILLFEQPIRVGDIVTVGTTTGRVTRIRIRATTIQDWERKELIVPNRAFVTSEFVNWTLADSVVRWTIPVGVAYGTDTKKALDLLREVASESRFVVKNPPPETVFVAFGDSTLMLQLRLYVDMENIEYQWMSELNQAIDRKLREAGIEIAFPQRDVHIKFPETIFELLRARDVRSVVQ